ncbi:hypothetical protein NQ318_022564 [Aromia moschata]|uniref:DUF4817 domain-containing protein n=1 Tax=Aromia moschata TaxID=1265417 RepID=A0AAV8XPW9_9CUCU|nr:hypothetical protein NQ318_022564 [Aromia moschata]
MRGYGCVLMEQHTVRSIRCGDKTRTQKQVCEIFNSKCPDRRISQSTVGRIENKFREFGNVTDIPKSVRVLDPLKSTYALILTSKTLSVLATLARVVLETLQIFELSRSQVLMFVSDGVATMHGVGRSLQDVILIHVTCKVHALHLVAETIRLCIPEVDALIATTKKRGAEISETSACIPQQMSQYSRTTTVDSYTLGNMIGEFNPNEAAAIKNGATKEIRYI